MVLYGVLVVIVILFRPSGLMGNRELSWKDVKNGFVGLRRKLGGKAKAAETAGKEGEKHE